MRPIEQNLEVRHRYSVHFTTNLFSSSNNLLRSVIEKSEILPAKVLLVADRGLLQQNPDLLDAIKSYCRRHRDVFDLVAPPLVVPGGERVKNSYRYIRMVLEAIHRFGICRQSYVLAIGGGAVLDMAGCAAATAHRGVRLVRIPSTVLSQNDSGVGVKNGINAFGKKNFLGTFAPPYAVLNDFALLASLSDRDWRSGAAEAVKVALIKDADFFCFLEQNARNIAHRNIPLMQRLIYRCAELHLQHIAGGGDPFEMGSSRPLDFGHWAAHKLEQLTRFRLRHGEAVAIGIALDSTYSFLRGLLPEPDWRRILHLLSEFGFDLYVPELDSQSLMAGLSEFREHLGGKLTVMLLEGIGQGIEVHDMDEHLIAAGVRVLHKMSRGAPSIGISVTQPATAWAAAQR